MSIEEYILALQKIQKEHPGIKVAEAYFPYTHDRARPEPTEIDYPPVVVTRLHDHEKFVALYKTGDRYAFKRTLLTVEATIK